MNLFKKQKFSIRKFSVGTFSTVIATLTFLSHPGHAATHDEENNISHTTSENVRTANNDKTNSEGQPSTIERNTPLSNMSNHNQAEDTNSIRANKEVDAQNNLSAENSKPEISNPSVEVNKENHSSEEHTNADSTLTSNNKTQENVNKQNGVSSEVRATDTTTTNELVTNSDIQNKPHKRSRRSVDVTATPNNDPMAINETNSGQIINGSFTDTSNGAVIPTNATESERNPASKVTGWHVNNSSQTEIPLVWGPKGLSLYNYYTFDKTRNKVAAVLSAYTESGLYGAPDSKVGSIYQDVDVTPGSVIQLHYISGSMGNTGGMNGARVYIYDANQPNTLLYKGRPSTSSMTFGNFVGVFNVPETISKLRFRFESTDNRTHEHPNQHRLLKGPNNYGGGLVADVTVNSGAYLTATTPKTDYVVTSPSATADSVRETINFSIQNRGHSRSNKTKYKVILPEGAKYISAQHARGSFNSDTRELTLDIGRIDAGGHMDVSYQISLPASTPLQTDIQGTLNYVTEGVNMNRMSDSRDLGSPGDDHFMRYGVRNEFIKNESSMREGNYQTDRQTLTVKMFKNDLQAKVTEIETYLNGLNQDNYTPEAWTSMQNVLNQAKHILSETDDTPISERKNQVTINDLTLSLDKERAKLTLDQLAKAKREEFNNNSDATNEEKEAVIEQVNNPLEFSKAAIDASHDINEINSNKESGVTTISGLTFGPTVKNDAIQELMRVVDSKKAEIDQTPNATDEEKAAAKARVDAAVNEAKHQINQATTNQGVDEAKKHGTDSINQVQPTVVKKDEAKQAIDAAATVKKAEIDQTPNATDEEKAAAKAKVDEAVTEAKHQIDQATNNQNVDDAKTHGTDSIKQVQPTVVKKDEAKQAIDAAATAKKAEIDQTPNATDEEKAAAKAKVDVAVTEAKSSIDQATNNQGVDDTKGHGIDLINHVQPTVVKKDEAKQAIDAAATVKKAEIDQTPNATDEEKSEAKAKVDKAVTEAKHQVDQATNNQGVDEAKTHGTDSIKQVQPTVVKKDEAKQAIDAAATTKKAEIDQTPNATDEEKAAAKAKVDEAVTEAKHQIDQTTTNQGVDDAKGQGIESINHVQPTVVKKEEAKQAIDAAAIAKKAEIDKTPNATDEEKAAAKAKVDAAVNEAKHQINQATTNQGVDEAKTHGTDSINQVQPTVVKKDEAKQAIDVAATAKKAEIDQTPNATDEEKSAAKAKVDAAVNEAKHQINQATTNQGVDEAKTHGTDSINQVQPTVVKKDEAKQAIDVAATAKKAEIDQTPNATDEEKSAAKAKVDAAVNEAKHQINQATTNQGVDEAKTHGTDLINQVQPTVVKKDEAKQAIDAAATAKKAEIDQTPNATDEEKAAAKAKVDVAVTEAKSSIDQATNNQGVDEAKTHGTDLINHVQPTVVKKDEAKQVIDAAAIAKKAEIDKTPNATDEEKSEAKAKVDEAVTEVKHQIDQTTTNQGVDDAKGQGIESINHVQPTVVKKDEAKQAIDAAAIAKKAEIDQTPNATDEEKAAAKAKVDVAVTEAKSSIDQVTNNQGVDEAKTHGTDSINQVQPTVVKKDEAKQAIDAAATAKKAEIDQIPNATDEEKAAAKAKVDEAVTEAKHQIDQATNNQGVDEAKTHGTDSINQVQPTVVKKDEAKQAIDAAATAKKSEIDQTPNATDEEKSEAKAKVDEAVTEAKHQIDQATNNQGVDEAKTHSIESINQVQPTVVKKDEAKRAIDAAAIAKKAEIDKTPNATDEEKSEAKAKVDEAVTEAKH
ncbi:DUF1542 domain-containing protein, partial [Staphylococcus hominis]|uniref:SasC/FmtB family protein n=2 Tax=Staphylococcus hominis TaxID=1290 RepID=UPI001F5605CD